MLFLQKSRNISEVYWLLGQQPPEWTAAPGRAVVMIGYADLRQMGRHGVSAMLGEGRNLAVHNA